MKHSTVIHRLTHAALLLALGTSSSFGWAQTANNDEKIEEIVITGKFLRSLQSAMEQKRNSASMIEAIAAEDIGQLPDVSISDSLNRLPGLAQDRDRGNGSQISIRGMGGLLGLTTLNGREVATVEEDRNIRYDQFPSELINAAQVYKTPQAHLPEGGLSGTVNLETIKPLDFDSRQMSVDVRGSFYDLGGDIDDAANDGWGHRFSVSYIDQFLDDTLGVALGYAGRSQPIATQRSELWNYGDTWHNTQWNDALGTNVNAPWGGSALIRGGEDRRHGVMGAIQWQPNDNLEIAYDGFWSTFDIDETQRGFDFQIANTYTDQWQLIDTTPTAYTNPELGEGALDLLSGTVPLSSLRNLNEEFAQEDTLISHGLNVEWRQDAWTFEGDLSYSKTERDRRWASIRTTHAAPGYATFGATGDKRMWLSLDTADLTDPAQNSVSEIEVRPAADGGDEITAFQLDVTRELDAGLLTAVRFGASVSQREKFLNAQNWLQYVTDNSGTPIPEEFILDAKSDSYWNDLPDYLTFDRNAVIDYYFGGLANPDVGDADDLLSSWDVSEDISAQYVQLDFATEIFALPLTGNIGVRAAQTETTSSGYQQGPNVWVETSPGVWEEMAGEVEAVAIDHDYDEVLPSLNMTLAVTDEQQVRLGVAKTIARAPVDLMSTSLNLNDDLFGANPGESSSGNPKLDPFRATQVDLGYEWYFNDESSVAATVYYKDLDTFIARAADAEQIVYNGTTYNVSRPINGEGGYIRGYEVLYQQAFSSLPEPFNGLGVYANYAFTESNVEQFVPLYSTKSALTGLSEHVGNLTLWYYKDGFEARTSYSYRSEFQRDINAVQGEEGINDSEGYVDLSLSYEMDDHYKFYFQVQNLTNEPYRVYGLESNNPNHVNKYEEFGRRYMVGVSCKL